MLYCNGLVYCNGNKPNDQTFSSYVPYFSVAWRHCIYFRRCPLRSKQKVQHPLHAFSISLVCFSRKYITLFQYFILRNVTHFSTIIPQKNTGFSTEKTELSTGFLWIIFTFLATNDTFLKLVHYSHPKPLFHSFPQLLTGFSTKPCGKLLCTKHKT